MYITKAKLGEVYISTTQSVDLCVACMGASQLMLSKLE